MSILVVHQIADVKQFGSFFNVWAPVLRLTFPISRPTLSWQGCCSVLRQSGGDSRDAGRSVWPSNTHLEALYCCYLAPFTVTRLHFHCNLVPKVETLLPFYCIYRKKEFKQAAWLMLSFHQRFCFQLQFRDVFAA